MLLLVVVALALSHCLLLAAQASMAHERRLSRERSRLDIASQRAAPVQLDGGPHARVMPHLTLPTAEWSTYNLSRSTYTNVCFGPTFQKSSPLNKSAGWLSKWSVLPASVSPSQSYTLPHRWLTLVVVARAETHAAFVA